MSNIIAANKISSEDKNFIIDNLKTESFPEKNRIPLLVTVTANTESN